MSHGQIHAHLQTIKLPTLKKKKKKKSRKYVHHKVSHLTVQSWWTLSGHKQVSLTQEIEKNCAGILIL